MLGPREYGDAMACRITELVLDCRNPEVLADFWCRVLGFVVLETEEDGSIEIGPAGNDPENPGLTLVFSPSGEPKRAKLRLHFDVNAVDRGQDEELRRLHELGAQKADVGQTGEESWHVLADPEGNEFCLLRRTVQPAS
jgi:catechol 2,3-dioxygenase-like lactoylglutathione lyase family enzyme